MAPRGAIYRYGNEDSVHKASIMTRLPSDCVTLCHESTTFMVSSDTMDSLQTMASTAHDQDIDGRSRSHLPRTPERLRPSDMTSLQTRRLSSLLSDARPWARKVCCDQYFQRAEELTRQAQVEHCRRLLPSKLSRCIATTEWQFIQRFLLCNPERAGFGLVIDIDVVSSTSLSSVRYVRVLETGHCIGFADKVIAQTQNRNGKRIFATVCTDNSPQVCSPQM